MSRQETRIRVTFLVALIVVYSIPFDLATYYVASHFRSNPVWDSSETIPTIILGLAQRQQVLLDLFQKLLIPIVVALSVLWLRTDSQTAAPPAPGVPGAGGDGNGLIGLRYGLGAVCLLLFVTVVANYVVVDNLSNYIENDQMAEKAAVLSYLSNGIENSITIVALLIGINMTSRSV